MNAIPCLHQQVGQEEKVLHKINFLQKYFVVEINNLCCIEKNINIFGDYRWGNLDRFAAQSEPELGTEHVRQTTALYRMCVCTCACSMVESHEEHHYITVKIMLLLLLLLNISFYI